MSKPFVSSYIDAIRKTFSESIENVDFTDQEKLVKELADKILDQTADRVHDYVTNELITRLQDTICGKAAEVAEHMLRDALAGDDKTLRNLFDFNEWYMKHSMPGHHPKQWALINAIVEKNPQLFVDERLLQKDKEIALWKSNYEKIKSERDTLFDSLAKERGHYG